MPWKKLVRFSALALAGLLLTFLSAVIPAGWNSIYSYSPREIRTISTPASLRPSYLGDSWPLSFSAQQCRPLWFQAADGETILCDGFGTTVTQLTFIDTTDNADQSETGRSVIHYSLDIFSHGWPFRALAYHEHGIGGGLPSSLAIPLVEDAAERAGWRRGIEFPSWITIDRSIPRKIPLIPIMPGLIVDFVFWTGVVWVVFIAPFRIRRMFQRHQRLKRGQCLKCGYDLAGLPRCPECGQYTKPDAQNA